MSERNWWERLDGGLDHDALRRVLLPRRAECEAERLFYTPPTYPPNPPNVREQLNLEEMIDLLEKGEIASHLLAKVEAERSMEVVGSFGLLEQSPEARIAEVVDFPIRGNLTQIERMQQAVRVYQFWATDMLFQCLIFRGSWSSLNELSKVNVVLVDDWYDVVLDYVEYWTAWPTADYMRRMVNHAPTTRQLGESDDQGELL